MADTLRSLLLQRAARLQERPAFTAPAWGTLDYSHFRARVEGLAMGLLATGCPCGTALFCATGTPWDWAVEVAVACSGLRWEKTGTLVEPTLLGGSRFNAEQGRGPYHEQEEKLNGNTLFSGSLDHAAMLQRLRRLNRILGWDHQTNVRLPLARIGAPEIRAALWCALYAGSHAILEDEPPAPKGMFKRWTAQQAVFDPGPFYEFWGLS